MHKKTPTRPIVSSRDSVTYGVAKVIVSILKFLVGRTQHHVHNTQHFLEQIKDISLGPRECITSYELTALFTSVPVATTLKVVQNKKEQDQDLHLRMKHTVQRIELLGFCLHNTYFIFKGKYYEQVDSVTMESPVRLIIANMEYETF